MKRDDLIYLAGLFDGEGCIHIAKKRCNKNDKKRRYGLLITMGISRKREALDLLKGSFGGSIQKHVIRRSKKLMKIKRWIWYLTGAKALIFLRATIPYLRMKKPEASKALEYQMIGGDKYGKRISEEELVKRKKLYYEMRRLKGS